MISVKLQLSKFRDTPVLRNRGVLDDLISQRRSPNFSKSSLLGNLATTRNCEEKSETFNGTARDHRTFPLIGGSSLQKVGAKYKSNRQEKLKLHNR